MKPSLQSLLHHRSTVFIFAISLCAGGFQFAGQAFLARHLPSDDFSRVSFVLSQFSTYLLLVELGIQGELIRKLSSPEKSFQPGPTLALRLVGAFAGYVTLVLQGVFAGVSTETLLALCLFGLTLFPAAVLLQAEVHGFAEHRPVLATALRLSRLAALAFYLGAVAFFPAYCFPLLLIFPIVFLVMIILFACVLPHSARAMYDLNNLKKRTLKLASEVWGFATGTGLWWVFNASFALLCLKKLGDKNLMALTIGQTLTIPIALLAQAVSNSWISKNAKKGALKLSVSTRIGFLVLIVFFIALLCSTPILHLLFPTAHPSHIRLYFVPFALSQLFIAFNGFTQVAVFARGHKKIGFMLPLVSLLVLGIGSFFVNAETLAVLHFVCYFSCAVYLSFVSRLDTK